MRKAAGPPEQNRRPSRPSWERGKSVKIKEVMEFTDRVKPNAYTEEQKLQWLNDCEGMVQTQVFLFAPVEIVRYALPADKNTELLVEKPHDKLYLSYLYAMIDFANGEYNKYQNSMQMFNTEFSEFMRWFAGAYRPADTNVEGENGVW